MYCQMCEDKGGCNFCQRRKPNKNKIKSTPTQSPLPTGLKGPTIPKGPTGPKGHTGTGPKGLTDKNKIKSNPTQSPLPTGPKGSKGPTGLKGHTGKGPKVLADPKRKPYQNPPLVSGPKWNTTGIEDFNKTTVDHGLNIETPTLKKVIYLETTN